MYRRDAECADCAHTLGAGGGGLGGVVNCEVNFANAKMRGVGEVEIATVEARIRTLGGSPFPGAVRPDKVTLW